MGSKRYPSQLERRAESLASPRAQEVINDIGSTEGKLGDEKNGDWVAKESSEPAERYQCSTEPPSHDDGVVQWVTDGLVPIISHYC